jgi:hypothetical protein
MGKHSEFPEVDWGRLEADRLAWRAGELDRPLIKATYTDPMPLAKPCPGFIPQLPMNTPTTRSTASTPSACSRTKRDAGSPQRPYG